MHLQLPQTLNFPSSTTETLPSTLAGPRLTYRKTRRKRSGDVTLRVTTTLGWWERERGEKQSTPSVTSTAHSCQPKRSRSASLLPKQHATAQGGDKHIGPAAQSWHSRPFWGQPPREQPACGALSTSGRCCGTTGWFGYPRARTIPEERF